MVEPRKDKTPLQQVPTRKLVAGIKKDLRRMLAERKAQQPPKSKKGKG